jgi:type I restriction enzyme S subunit
MLTLHARTILGPIPDDWDAVPLKDLLNMEESYSGDWGDDSGDVPLKILRSTNISNDGQLSLENAAPRWFSEKKASDLDLRATDLLLERSGGGPDQPVGRVVFVDRDLPGYGYSNFMHRLRVRDGAVFARYLYYCLFEVHRSGVVERLQFQTTQMRNLDYRDYTRICVPLPKVDEQEIIARFLDESDRLLQVTKEGLGITASLHRDQMQGPISRLKVDLLRTLITGRLRIKG